MAMGIHKKLTNWQEAGLITPAQGDAIAAYEQGRKSGRFLRALSGIALFAILCGVLSVVAANWMDIPGGVKIAAHIMLNTAIGFALYHAQRPAYREGLCLLLFGLTLTLIALIGQVFQLGGGWAGALALWLVITAPLMIFFAETKITAVPWVVGFLMMLGMAFAEYMPPEPHMWHMLLVFAVGIFLPLALIADGNLSFVRRFKPAWSSVFIGSGFALLLWGATVSSVFWYPDIARDLGAEYDRLAQNAGYAASFMPLALTGLLSLAVIAQLVYMRMTHLHFVRSEQGVAAKIALLGVVMNLLPFCAAYGAGAVAASLHVILLWVAIGYWAQQSGWQSLVTLAIIVLTVRIFIIYCELFGDLMMTGFGLISGGLIMLALIWGAHKINRHVRQAGA